ncbi:hypothetical protein K2P56_03905 [Patescibacteria group bacterium]|nr:hypothetical protein [Patescibacteria group bacterium]
MQVQALKTFGLTQNESAVFVALLKLKSASGVEVGEKSGLPKSTAYDALRGLSQKGLVNIYKKRGRKHFSVNDPTVLRELALERKNAIERVLPSLLALYEKGDGSTKVEMHKGKDGFARVSGDILEEADELFAIGSPEELFKDLPEFFPRFTKKRKEKGIFLRGIFRDSPKARERQIRDAEDLRQSKLVEPPLPFSPLMYIWKQKIAMVTLGDDVSVVVIENKELSQMMRSIFELLWRD